jgi:hypothetical protein
MVGLVDFLLAQHSANIRAKSATGENEIHKTTRTYAVKQEYSVR